MLNIWKLSGRVLVKKSICSLIAPVDGPGWMQKNERGGRKGCRDKEGMLADRICKWRLVR